MTSAELTRRVAILVLLAATYALTGWLGLQLPYYGANVTLVWPPVGIALAAVIRLGVWVAPGIAIGAFAVNFAVGTPAAGAMGIAFGNTVGPVATGWILRRLGISPQLDRSRDVAAFVCIGAFACAAITASFGVLSLVGGGLVDPAQAGVAWLGWIAGDGTGVMIVGAALLVWSVNAPPPRSPRSRIETALLAAAWGVTSAIVLKFGHASSPVVYLYYPVGLWAAVRFGTRGSAAIALATAAAIVPATAAGFGPFTPNGGGYNGMVGLWAFATAVPSTGLILGAVLMERDHALAHKDRLMHELDHRVKNALALMSSIAERSGASAVDVSSFVDTFVRRVQALARSHEALARSMWQGVSLHEIVREITVPYVLDDRAGIAVSGADQVLPAHCAAPVAMILHELATNAAKHGAWRSTRGLVSITWGETANGGLRLSWVESGVAPAELAPKLGYGLTIVAGFVEYELGGEVALDFGDDGLTCVFDVPGAELAASVLPA